MKFFGDYHTHSNYSDGRGSIEEMIKAASSRGLREVGITDHGPANIGTGVKSEKIYLEIKEKVGTLQQKISDIRVLVGAEANIINIDGELDLSREIIEQLDYTLAGLHPYVRPPKISEAGWLVNNQALMVFPCIKPRVVNGNTKALAEAIYRYDIKAITHPGLRMPIAVSEVAKACVKCDTAWEINTGHEHPGYHEVLEAARFGVDFIVNSDAHFPESVGRFEYGIKILKKAGIPAERVRNVVSYEE